MYYQVYNKRTGEVLITCPDAQSAHEVMKAMSQPDLRVRPINKSDHPLARKY